MKNFKPLVAVAVASMFLAGCLGNQYGNKQLGGAILGGAGGGWLGSQIGGSGKLAATAGGAILGMLLGSEVGKSLDRADRLSIIQSRQIALERNQTGQTRTWNNPDRQVYTTITPSRAYRERGRYCREYQQKITVHGKTERAYGKACRQPDGTWQIVNDQTSSAVPVYYPQNNAVFNGGSSCRWVYSGGRRYCGRWR